MNTNKIIAAAAIGLCSLTALSAWAQTEKYVEISTKGQYITCPASDINYIDVFDQLTPPTNVTATYSDGKIHLSWDEVEGATSYDIYCSCSHSCNFLADFTDYYSLIDTGNLRYATRIKDNSYIIDTSDYRNTFCNFYGIINFYIGANDEHGRHGALSSGVEVTKIRPYHITVRTLCGYKSAGDSQGAVYGPFETTSGFNLPGSMAFDPLYPNRLYIVYEGGLSPNSGIVQLDLEANTHTLLMSKSKFENKRVRNCAFTKDGQYMLVSTHRNDNGYDSPGVWIIKRNDDGTFSDESSMKLLAACSLCNSVAVHPVNGEVYFISADAVGLYRIDIDRYFNTISEGKEWSGTREYESFGYASYRFDRNLNSISIHPSGNYAYLNCSNGIWRTDYDWNKKKFTTPYCVIGGGKTGFMNGESYSAELDRAYQGVFVKNSNYDDRELDEYDYYFTDENNFCIRQLTSMRKRLQTVVGHASVDNMPGYEDGNCAQARFSAISGLAYDENTKNFYVLDNGNRCIRTFYSGRRRPNTSTK